MEVYGWRHFPKASAKLLEPIDSESLIKTLTAKKNRERADHEQGAANVPELQNLKSFPILDSLAVSIDASFKKIGSFPEQR